MGTNYYLKKIPTKKEIEKVKRLLDGRDFDSAKRAINEMTRTVHVGIQSCGWQFCFRVNKEYGKTYKQVFDFIRNGIISEEWELVDEYGKVIAYDDFELLVNSHKNKWNCFTSPERQFFDILDHNKTDSISKDGSWWCNVDFC